MQAKSLRSPLDDLIPRRSIRTQDNPEGAGETMKCGWGACGKLFEPNRYSNQHHKPHGRHHERAIYCSRSCQQKAYRWRLQASHIEGLCTGVRGTVTPQKNDQSSQQVTMAKNDLPWCQISGPKLTPLQFRSAAEALTSKTYPVDVEGVQCGAGLRGA
jgi:hypothetical protein